MGASHLVRIGLMGVVRNLDYADFHQYPRDTRVICRTDRGLEQGTVICPIDDEFGDRTQQADQALEGEILRKITPDDDMILTRLEKHRDKAFQACQKIIIERELPGILVDVEHLFDGESVFFYFLGEVDNRLESITDELAETYELRGRFKKFAETLAGGCQSCALSGGCGSKSK